MRNLALLLTLLALLLCGCQANDPTDGIEFFTLHDDIWAPVTSSSVTAPPETDAPIETLADTSADKTDCTYVLNRSSKKFHDPACSSVGKIKEENREYFSGERADLVSRGYEPCKICNP